MKRQIEFKNDKKVNKNVVAKKEIVALNDNKKVEKAHVEVEKFIPKNKKPEQQADEYSMKNLMQIAYKNIREL